MSSAVTCPGCNQENTTDMAFCIFCGTPLKADAKPSVAVGRGRKCVSCGQADSLNSQFCIYCGARVEGPVLGATGSASVGGRNGYEVAGGAGSGQSTHDQRLTSGRMLGFVAMGVAGLLGGAVGLLVAWFNAQNSPATTAVAVPPNNELTILTAAPNAAIEMVSKDKRRFLAGKTGPNGDLSLEKLRADEYHVSVVGPDGKKWEKDIDVKDDDPTIVGGPPDGEIFAGKNPL